MRPWLQTRLQALREAWRREPSTVVIFALATLATLLPVWIGRYLPLLDHPNHLTNVFVWFHLDDPQWNFQPYYARHLVPLPYWGQYGIMYGLMYVVDVETAAKIFLSLTVLALPAGVAVYARRVGRDPRLAIFAFPLAWSYNTIHGFINYCAGAALLFFALAALDAFAERPAIRRALVATLLGASLYFFHILAWAAYLALGGATVLFAVRVRPFKIWKLMIAPLPLIPAGLLGVWAYFASREMSVPKITPYAEGGLGAIEALWWSFGDLLRHMPDWLIDLFPDHHDEAAGVLLILFWLGLVITFRRKRSQPAQPAQSDSEVAPRTFRVELAFAVACLLLYYLPRTLRKPFYWYAVNSRIAILVALFAALLVRGSLVSTRARRVLFSLAGIVAIAYPLDVAAHFYRFNRRTRGFDEVMRALPRGALTLPLMVTQGAAEVNVNCFNQWGSYVQLRAGGYVPWNNEIDFPVSVKTRLSAPPRDGARFFRMRVWGREWDHFLVYSEQPVDLFADARGEVELAARAEGWSLWRKIAQAPPPQSSR